MSEHRTKNKMYLYLIVYFLILCNLKSKTELIYRNMLRIIILTFLLLQSFLLLAQPEQRIFNATIVAGFNASQIDGDNTAGYRKIGLNVGARAGVILSKRWETSFEILFSQQGAQTQLVRGIPRAFNCQLNYISVPLMIHFKDWEIINANNRLYQRFWFGAGISYNRLMGGFIDDPNGKIFVADITGNPFKKNHVTLLADINFFFTRNWGINLRYERAPMNIRENMLYNPHMIVFRGLFTF